MRYPTLTIMSLSSRSSITSFLIILALLPTPNANGQESSAELGVGAIGLVVSDLAESKHFYVDILGFSRTGGFSLGEEWSNEAGFSDGKPFSVEVFKLVDSPTATVLKLADFSTTRRAELSENISEFSGANYLTFNYQNLEDVLSRVEDEGKKIWGHIVRSNYQVVILRDSDGVFVELVAPPNSDK